MFKTRKKFIWSQGNSNIYRVYEIDMYVNISYSMLEIFLFGAVKLTKNYDIDLYKYSGYGIRFDRKWLFSINDEVGRNIIIFGVDRCYFRKWGQYTEDTKKGTFSLQKKTKNGTHDMASPYDHSLFTIVLIRQIKKKKSHPGQQLKVGLSFSLKNPSRYEFTFMYW